MILSTACTSGTVTVPAENRSTRNASFRNFVAATAENSSAIMVHRSTNTLERVIASALDNCVAFSGIGKDKNNDGRTLQNESGVEHAASNNSQKCRLL